MKKIYRKKFKIKKRNSFIFFACSKRPIICKEDEGMLKRIMEGIKNES